MFNTELANRTLDYIRTHPDEWNQDRWDECFAGIAVKLAGYKLSDGDFSNVVDDDGHFVGFIRVVAEDVLGITDTYFGRCPLFDHVNKLEDLERIVAELSEADNV